MILSCWNEATNRNWQTEPLDFSTTWIDCSWFRVRAKREELCMFYSFLLSTEVFLCMVVGCIYLSFMVPLTIARISQALPPNPLTFSHKDVRSRIQRHVWNPASIIDVYVVMVSWSQVNWNNFDILPDTISVEMREVKMCLISQSYGYWKSILSPFNGSPLLRSKTHRYCFKLQHWDW